jgi:hypothetical protein
LLIFFIQLELIVEDFIIRFSPKNRDFTVFDLD